MSTSSSSHLPQLSRQGSEAAAAATAAAHAAQSDTSRLTARQLLEALRSRGIDATGCSERSELAALLAASPPRKQPPAPTAATAAVPKPAASAAPRMSKCPYSSASGYTTAQGRQDWLKAHSDEIPRSEWDAISSNLSANLDRSQPLYYWQVNSLIGPNRIRDIVINFYKRLMGDKTPGTIAPIFHEISSVDHHVATQAAFWVDSMGGGRYYHGGDGRLNFHHDNNAHTVLHAAGAKRWMLHMGRALCDFDFSGVDERVKPCIVDFLRVKMQKYAAAERNNYAAWRYDESDFAFVAQDKEMVRLWRSGRGDTMASADRKHLRMALATSADLDGFAPKELKAFLAGRHVNYSHCVEKSELLSLAKASVSK